MSRKFPELKKAIELARLIKISKPRTKSYEFIVFPFGERGTKINAELLKEIVGGLLESINKNFPEFDYIVSPEPGGEIWGSIIALRLNKSINIMRPRPSYESGEIKVLLKTDCAKKNLYFNNLKKGDKVLIIDDVVSTGRTLEIILKTLKSLGVISVGVQVICVKSEDYRRIEKKYSVPIRFLVK